MLEKDPWFNATTVCEYPESFLRSSSGKTRQNFDVISNFKLTQKQSNERQRNEIPASKAEQILGQYGNFAYGNVTIVQDDVTEEIVANFDVASCTLILRQNNESYFCEGRDQYWFLDVLDFRFDASSNPAEFVDILFYDPAEGRIRFYRDLNLNDAPGPRDHWPTC